MYVTKLVTNLKNLGTQALGEKTLIVGHCASGKTGLPQAVEFALTGAASDVAGRGLVAEAALLATLGPEEGLKATVSLSNGTQASSELVPSGKGGYSKKVNAPHFEAPVFPLREVREALTGSTEKAQRFLLQTACREISSALIVEAFPSELRSYYGAVAHGETPIDQLLNAREEAGKRSRSLKKEADGAGKVIEAIGAGGRMLPDPQEVNRQLNVVLRLREQARIESQPPPQRADLSVLRARRETLIATLEEAKLRATAIGNRVAQIPEANEEDERRRNLRGILEAAYQIHSRHLRGDTHDCQVCHSSPGASHLTAKAQEFVTQYKAWTQETAHRDRELIERDALIKEYNEELKPGFTNSQQWLASIDATLNQEVGPVPSTSFQLGDSAADRLPAEEEKLARLQGAAATWDQVQRAQEQATDLSSKAKAWKMLVDACDDVVQHFVISSLQSFVTKVQKYLPTEDRFDIELEPFRFGFRREGRLHVALSGAEWVRTLCAIGAAISEGSDLAILFPEERAFDAKTLAETMKALAHAPAQVILTSTVAPLFVPYGWTVIDLSEAPIDVDQAPTKERKKRVSKTEKETLLALQWSERQIRDMLPEVRIRILDERMANTGYTVLPDGELAEVPRSAQNGVH